MTEVCRLHLRCLRNIQEANILLGPQFNLFFGANGSGKTSILESLQLLSQGRSFRSHITSHIICHEQPVMTIFAQLADDQNLGLEKRRRGKTRMRHDGKDVHSMAPLAQQLPLQFMHPERFRLVADSAQYRRQFLDWGLFHVEHRFYGCWQQYRTALAQRNAALKDQQSSKEVMIWDHSLSSAATQLHAMRLTYLAQFKEQFAEIAPELLPFSVNFHYEPGWSVDESLEESLKKSYAHDCYRGYTRLGPHRADLKMLVDDIPAAAVLSRGQQKLLVAAMALAQAKTLKWLTDKRCLFLIDDLPAELDVSNRHQLLLALQQLDLQIFVTSIQREFLDDLKLLGDVRMFHVEHGRVQAVSDG